MTNDRGLLAFLSRSSAVWAEWELVSVSFFSSRKLFFQNNAHLRTLSLLPEVLKGPTRSRKGGRSRSIQAFPWRLLLLARRLLSSIAIPSASPS